MRNRLFLMVGMLLLVVGCLLTLTACQPDPAVTPNDQGQTTIGQALIGTGSPWGLLAGTLVNIVASTFIAKGTSKSAVAAMDAKPWTADDVHAMATALQALGYTVQRSPTPPAVPPPV